MDLDLLKRFIDDGVAKHKGFVEWQDAVNSAVSLTQYVQELETRSKSLEGYIADHEDKIAKAKIDVANAEAKTRITLDELAKRVVDANRDYEIKIQAIKARHAEVQALLDSGEGHLQEQGKRIQESVATEQNRLAKEFERLDELQKIKIQSLKTQAQSWEEKLSASKLAYDNFIANLPK